jgi:hypothetical protein
MEDNMKTLVKQDTNMNARHPKMCYLFELENEAEIAAIIQESEKMLRPCPCCGREHPEFDYVFTFNDTPCLVGVVQPHRLNARCGSKEGCGLQSKTWYAEDNETDFREALRLIVEAWNRRPT